MLGFTFVIFKMLKLEEICHIFELGFLYYLYQNKSVLHFLPMLTVIKSLKCMKKYAQLCFIVEKWYDTKPNLKPI